MNEDSSTANNGAQDSANPNDLSTELSAADEAAFVDRQLGITDSGAEINGGGDDKNGSGSEGDETEKTGAENGAAGSESGESGDAEEGSGDDSAGEDGAAKSTENGASDAGAKDGEESEDASGKQGDDDQADKSTDQLEGVDTSDLWVEIEDAEGKTHKVSVSDSLPEGFAFKNDAQLAEYLEARNEMKQTLNQRQADFDKQQQETSAAKAQQDQLAAWDAEVSALVEAKLLDEPKALPKNGKTYTEAELKADPALQKINDIYAFMGSKGLRSFGTAYTLWSQEQAASKEAQELEESNKTAKARGSLVGGSSSSSGSDAGYVYSAGSASSIHDVDTSDI